MSSTSESPTLTTSLCTAAVSQTSTSKHKPVRLCFRYARSHRISRARKPQVWLLPGNKACPLLCGAPRDTGLWRTNSLTDGASRLRTFCAGRHPVPTPELCVQFGEFLSQLHGANPPPTLDKPHWMEAHYLRQSLEELSACRHLQGHWIFTAQAALDYEALFALPRTLVHGDLHHHNVLVDSQGKASAILDWEECGTGVAVRVSACFLVGECGDVPHSTR